ncbi:hypothetical protein C3747_73g112 [Trypanosoma cruzi]|uniref:Uncharacterized protein n=3 Tax=Trypanosoma cruzi TaxID=5693 RepID=Q4DBT8_TRYCC|nr:hypothetical protein, conserved [Trypanosoma cruzi]EAN89992.1 hypothetical protein, conserved [Trypanosoma cruzi]KAF8297539.1 hypothetical protein TcYC6_0079150 [Trypanosoma cruzi]PWV10039.1 hypothetical protein C3747_73g112 [Trypanosoma cruzi]|eukprot:XP_811843.1 hypothetical protein [Trypanosoma cruzi strain CL Brener]
MIMLMASRMRRESVTSRRLTLRLSHNTATTSVFGVSLLQSRGIRTVIAPRPAVTTLVYIDKYGRPLRNSTETDLSLIRTRDNKFYLQRVLEGGEVIRWRAPGLDHLKNVTNFETYTLNEIDEYGGVVIPADLMPTASNDPPSFHDAVYYINRVEAKKKFTRKDRRQWHRRLFAHWKESPEKFLNHSIGAYGMPFLFVLWLTIRGFHSIKNNKPFWDVNVYGKTDEEQVLQDPWLRLKRFSDRHPEHEGLDMTVTMMSPGQSRLSSSRAEIRETDFTDPHFHSELWWKIRHVRYYGHWPKGLAE